MIIDLKTLSPVERAQRELLEGEEYQEYVSGQRVESMEEVLGRGEFCADHDFIDGRWIET